MGNLLLKGIIRESHLDTNATTTNIRESLSLLDTYMPTITCDVTKFNKHVRQLELALHCGGEHTSDLLTNLFKGYLAALDCVFIDYIAQTKEACEDKTVKALTPDKLMEKANNKFKLHKERNEWNAPSPDKEKILALEAQVAGMKKAQNKSNATKPKGKGAKGGKKSLVPKVDN